MDNFQTILTAIFLAFFVFGVLIFSGVIKIGTSKAKTGLNGNVVIWGTFTPDINMYNIYNQFSGKNYGLNVSYIKKDSTTYQQDLIEAFANGTGPDLFIISEDMLIRNSNFMYTLPYETYPQKTFQDTFVDGASIYLNKDGVSAFPLVVDPMVMYYNKDILKNQSIVYPPKTWDELFPLNSSLTVRDNSGTVSRSMIALGQYDNVNDAKDILATLLIQNGSSIVEPNATGYTSTLDYNPQNLNVSPIQAVLTFFTEFSNSSDISYSWNRALPNSFDMFTGSKLAFYLGRASELFKIEDANPNLSFDVTGIPQVKDAVNRKTFGKIYAVAVNRRSTNLSSALGVASLMSSGDSANNFSISVSLPPALKSLLAKKPNDPYLYTFFDSALITYTWLDPDENKSDSIFKELINSVLSDSQSAGNAIRKAQQEFDLLLGK